MKGPKPGPTHLKLIRGNPGKRPIKEDDVQPTTELPATPPHLSQPAKVEFERMAKLLYENNLLTGFDVGSLAAYAQLYGRWADAEAELNKDREHPEAHAKGLLILTSNGHLIQNPLVGVANKAAADMVRYCVEFGMTPSSRTRLRTSPREDKQDYDPIAAYGV